VSLSRRRSLTVNCDGDVAAMASAADPSGWCLTQLIVLLIHIPLAQDVAKVDNLTYAAALQAGGRGSAR
jgi:hypothetical protein